MADVQPFALERFFAKHEFKAKYLLCCSDCEALGVQELLEMADADSKQLWASLTLCYTESQGLPALREEVAALYTEVKPDDLVICAPEEGIYLSMQALLSPGDHVVVVAPAYQSLSELVVARGCRLSTWEVELGEDGGAAFKVEALKELLEADTKLVVVNFPHNPTGALPSQSEWKEVVECCRERGAWLFSDEMYRHLELSDGTQLPTGVDLYDRALSLCGLSKSLSAPGLRIGWVACRQPAVVQRLLQLKDYTTICNNAPGEVLALMAMRARERLWAQNVALIQSNIPLADAFFKKWSNSLTWKPPVAGPICFPRLTNSTDVEKFCEWVVAGCGVLLLPATTYLHAPSAAGGHFRLSLGRKSFPTCLQVLDSFLTEQAAAGKWS